MTEDNNNQNDQPTKRQPPPDETQTEYREISKEELNQILEDHLKWVESEGKEGKIADFTKRNLKDAYIGSVNLQGAYFGDANLKNVHLSGAILKEGQFSGANLQSARLIGANLQKANFGDANLQEACLWNVDLKCGYLSRASLQNAQFDKADLIEADFKEANLKDANLTETKLHMANFVKVKLQRANLENAEGIANANLQYANMEGATGLLGNEFAQADVTGAKLPGDIKEFKALDVVEKTSQNARKIFFAMLLGCVYSWLTIATTTDVRLLTNTASSPLPIIGTEIPIAWFYIAAPLVLICLYFYFHLYLDNLWGALASLPAIFPDGKRLDERAYPWLLNTLVRRHFKRLKNRPLIARMKEWITIFLAWWVVPFTLAGFWTRYLVRHELIGTAIHIVLLLFSIAFSLIFYHLCKTILQGDESKAFSFRNFWNDKKSDWVIIIGFILILLSNFGFTNWGANFREKDVSMKPSDYYKIEPVEKQIESVKGANLKGANLKNADMYKAFLVKADLRKALLNGAYLREANLQEAELSQAKLQQAKLGGANLQEANLRGANLQESNLFGANLQDAELYKTNLQNAHLRNVDLRDAENLTIEQLSQAKTLYKAKLDPELLEQVKKCCPHLLEEPKEEKDETN